MNRTITEQVLDHIEDAYLCEALSHWQKEAHPRRPLYGWLVRASACLVAALVMSASLLLISAKAGNVTAFDMLYARYPQIAVRLVPVSRSCESNGIRMTVEAISIRGNQADVYISMQDLTGSRIDETMDLFDSYHIHTACDQIGGCSLVHYDAAQKTATFLITVRQMDDTPITDRSMTFGVSQFLSGKSTTEKALPEIRLADAPSPAAVQTAVNLRGSGYSENAKAPSAYLIPDSAMTLSPANGVQVTAYGFIDNELHIQVHYEDILRYDNHGYLYVKNADGDILQCRRNDAFWDSAQTGSYEEYIFDISPQDALRDYTVWGYFHTCETLTKGNWKVHFPIQPLP